MIKRHICLIVSWNVCIVVLSVEWTLQDNLLEKTKWGDPLPQLYAKMTWIQTNKGKIPPRNVTFDDWLACATAPWRAANVTGCLDVTQPPGAYLADLMFSPRRDFAAVVFQDELYVLGGRARELEQIHEEETRGGIIGPRMPRWRELSVLKNDVWKSNDAGTVWSMG